MPPRFAVPFERLCWTRAAAWGSCREPNVYAINHPAARTGAHLERRGVCNPWREVGGIPHEFTRHDEPSHVTPCSRAAPG